MPAALLNSQFSIPAQRQGRWYTLNDAADRTGLSVAALRKRCNRDYAARGVARLITPAAGGKPAWHVHESIHASLASCPDHQTRDQLADLSDYPAHRIERAQQKVWCVRRFEELRFAAESSGRTEAQLRDQVASEAADKWPGGRFSDRSIRHWRKQYHQLDAEGQLLGIRALIDGYESPAAHRVGTSHGGPARGPEAIEYFETLYLTQQQNTVAECHRRTLAAAGRNGWSWPQSVRSTEVWVKERFDRSMLCLLREGPESWRHRYAPYIEQDYDAIQAGDMYVCDHRQFNCFVRHGREVVRPWLTAILDVATRVVVGWHVAGNGGNSDTVLSALYRAFTRWGVPTAVKIDNGKDFDSKVVTGTTKAERRALEQALGPDWQDTLRREHDKVEIPDDGWFGLLPELGCRVVRALPFNPQSKSVERLFKTLDLQFDKFEPTFCGTGVGDKPEDLKELLADSAEAPLLDDLAKRFGLWVDRYHQAAHRGQGMGGLSPQQKWKSSPDRPRVADEASLALMCSVRGVYKVGANGVRVKVGSTTLGYGQYDAKLARWKGRKVLVAVDAADVSRCQVFTPDRDKRQLITVAEANERYSPLAGVDTVRTAMKRKQRATRDARRAAASAPDRMRTVAAIARDEERKQAAELRATGTDDHQPEAPLKPVRTGFEAAATRVQKAVRPPSNDGLSVNLRELLIPQPDAPEEQDAPSWNDGDLLRRDDFETELEDRTDSEADRSLSP